MAAASLIDGVQKLVTQNVQKATRIAAISTSKVLASLSLSNSDASSKKTSNYENELENILDKDSGFGSLVAAGSVDEKIQLSVPKTNAKQLIEAQRDAEMKRHRLMQLQIEAVEQRAADLSKLLLQSKSFAASAAVCNDIASHLVEHPEAVEFYSKNDLVPLLLREATRSQIGSKQLVAARRCLALMGQPGPVKGQGVSILTLDGGGMKGLALLEILKQLEKALGRPLYECFDYVMGVSTGGIVALLIFLLKTSLRDCEKLYMDLGTKMFSRATVVGTSQLLLNQAFYDSQLWEEMLKSRMEGTTFADFAGESSVPKVSILSTAASGSFLRPYLFRNYNPPCSEASGSLTYPLLYGSAKYKLWQGCRASSAAPFYYDEYKLDGSVFMDGGLVANNPTAFALNESSVLWPDEDLNCVVSVGTGRPAEAWLPMIPSNLETPASKVPLLRRTGSTSIADLARSPTLRDKIFGVVQAATDTEVTHSLLAGTLPKDKYFRMNPFLTENVNLDECRPETLALVQDDARRYAKLNSLKIKTAANIINKRRSRSRQLADLARTRLVASSPMISSSLRSFVRKANTSKAKLSRQKSLAIYGATRLKSRLAYPFRK